MKRKASYLLRAAIAASCGGLLAGCATTDDPHEGGLLGGLYGLGSGAYERRLGEREQELQAVQQMQAGSEAEQRALRQDKAGHETELERLRARSRQLDNELRTLTARIVSAKSSTGDTEKRKQSLKTQAVKLRGDLKTLDQQVNTAPANADLARYQAEEARLKREIEALKQELQVLD